MDSTSPSQAASAPKTSSRRRGLEIMDRLSSASRTHRFPTYTATAPTSGRRRGNDDVGTRPPPPYTPAAPALAGHDPVRVAMLPAGAPPGAPVYVGYQLHPSFLLPGSDARREVPAPLRGLSRTLLSICRSMRTRWRGRKHADSTAQVVGPVPLHDIGPGEIERPIVGKRQEWTRDWDFIFHIRNLSHGGHRCRDYEWVSHVRLYFRDISPYGFGTIPWNDPSRTARVWDDMPPIRHREEGLKWVGHTWKYCERSERPRWAASFTVYCLEGSPLDRGTSELGVVATLDDPWIFFHPTYTVAAEMDHRTGPERFKKVMWYFRMIGYGNDVLGQPVKAWEEEHQQQYVEYVRPFLPVSGREISSTTAASLGFWF